AGTLIGRPKGQGDVQVTVIVGELLPRPDIPDGELEVVGGGEAIRVEAVVDIASKVPTQDKISLVVPIAVGVQDVLVGQGQFLHLFRGEFPVPSIQDPGNGTGGNPLGGHHPIADLLVDKS